MRVGADRDDVVRGPCPSGGTLGVDAERDELDACLRRGARPRPRGPPPRARCTRSPSARGERGGVEPPHPLRSQPLEPLRQPDRRVHERLGAMPARALAARDAHGVDRGEDDVRAVRSSERREHGREVAAVAAGALERPRRATSRRPRPPGGGVPRGCARRRSRAPELVEPGEGVSLGRPRRAPSARRRSRANRGTGEDWSRSHEGRL